jgi:hypothetical protein
VRGRSAIDTGGAAATAGVDVDVDSGAEFDERDGDASSDDSFANFVMRVDVDVGVETADSDGTGPAEVFGIVMTSADGRSTALISRFTSRSDIVEANSDAVYVADVSGCSAIPVPVKQHRQREAGEDHHINIQRRTTIKLNKLQTKTEWITIVRRQRFY